MPHATYLPHATCHLPHSSGKFDLSAVLARRLSGIAWRLRYAYVAVYVATPPPLATCNVLTAAVWVTCERNKLQLPHTPQSSPSSSPSAHVIKCQCSWCAIPRDYPSHKCLRGRHSRVRNPSPICAAMPHKSARDIIRYSLTDYSSAVMATGSI